VIATPSQVADISTMSATKSSQAAISPNFEWEETDLLNVPSLILNIT